MSISNASTLPINNRTFRKCIVPYPHFIYLSAKEPARKIWVKLNPNKEFTSVKTLTIKETVVGTKTYTFTVDYDTCYGTSGGQKKSAPFDLVASQSSPCFSEVFALESFKTSTPYQN